MKYGVRLVSIVLLAVWGLVGCAANPVTGKQELHLISERQEVAIGEENYGPTQQSEGGQYDIDKELTGYVQTVGDRLAKVSDRPELPYDFVVLNNDVPNAWALPGGKIAINRGLLLELGDEAELAAVLAHEIVHAAARHSAQRMERGLLMNVALAGATVAVGENSDLLVGLGQVGAALITFRYSREAELEADRFGMIYMGRAGYEPEAAVRLQETFVRLAESKDPSWLEGLFSTHPPSRERVEANRRTAAELAVSNGRTGKAEYQRRIAHLKKTKPAYEAHQKGRKALADGKPAKARALAEQALAIEPREGRFHALLGDAYTAEKSYPEALKAYNQAISRNGDYYRFRLERGLLYQRLGRPEKARADLERSVKLLPTARGHTALGKLLQASGNRASAKEHFRVAALAAGTDGETARQAFTRLQLEDEPGAVVAVAAAATPKGELVLTIENQGFLPVRGVVVAVVVDGRRRTVRFPELLMPKAQARQATGLRVGKGRVQANVVQAQPAGAGR